MSIGDQLLANFARIAAADGGQLVIVSQDEACVRMGYRSGAEADCSAGVCVLPHAEIEEMMRAWMARRAPTIKLEVTVLEG